MLHCDWYFKWAIYFKEWESFQSFSQWKRHHGINYFYIFLFYILAETKCNSKHSYKSGVWLEVKFNCTYIYTAHDILAEIDLAMLEIFLVGIGLCTYSFQIHLQNIYLQLWLCYHRHLECRSLVLDTTPLLTTQVFVCVFESY